MNCSTPGHGPAAILVSFMDGPYLPYCDRCARMTYQTNPGWTSMKPLSEYVDDYTIARDAATLTPEQITGQVTQPPLREYTGEEYAARIGARQKPAAGRSAWWVLWLISPVSIIAGIAMAYHGMNLNDGNDGPIGTSLVLWGAFLILWPVALGIIWFLVVAGREAAREARRYRAWKASLSPEDRRKVELAEAAAAVAATAVIAADIHRRRERARAQTAARWDAYAQEQRDATQQAILGQLQQLNAPGTQRQAPADPIAALHERRRDANTHATNGWS